MLGNSQVIFVTPVRSLHKRPPAALRHQDLCGAVEYGQSCWGLTSPNSGALPPLPRPRRPLQGCSGSSTPQLPFKEPQIPFNREHKALNRATLGGLGSCRSFQSKGEFESTLQWPSSLRSPKLRKIESMCTSQRVQIPNDSRT